MQSFDHKPQAAAGVAAQRAFKVQTSSLDPEHEDQYEREADRLADAALSGRALAGKPRLPGAPAPASTWPVAPDRVDAVDGSLRAGAPMTPPVRHFFESRFGLDLSTIRIHTGDRAARGSEALRARAFASGPHLVFADGEYAPETSRGQRLIAHELAHVVQQGAAGAPSVQRHNAADPRLPADLAEALAFASAADADIRSALTSLAADAQVLRRNVPLLIAQEGITLRPLTPRHDSAVGAATINFFRGAVNYASSVALPAVATHTISDDHKSIAVRARDHADVDSRLFGFQIEERIVLAVLEAAERLATRSPGPALTPFQRYRARFNAIAEADRAQFILDHFDPALDSHGPRSTVARDIFDQIYASDPSFRSAYDADHQLKERVDSYMGPESLNPLASPGLQRLRAAFFPHPSPIPALPVATYNAFRADIQSAAASLTSEDRSAVEQSNAWQRLIEDHVRTPARRTEIKDAIANPPVAPAAAPPVPAGPVAAPPVAGAVTPQQFVDAVALDGPLAPVPSFEREVGVPLTPRSGAVANPGVAVSTQITVTPAAQVTGANVSPSAAWPTGATAGTSFSPQIQVSTGAALSAQLALTGGPARTNPIPPLPINIDDQRQANFITAWQPALTFNNGQFQADFVPGTSTARYISGAQRFDVVGTIPNPPHENPRLALSVEAKISRGATLVAGPQRTAWPALADRTTTVPLAVTAPSPFPVSGLDTLTVEIRLLDAGAATIDTRTISVDVGPESTYTQTAAQDAWTDDFDFIHTDTPSLLDLMTASGDSRRMGFAEVVRAGVLRVHPLVVRHDSAAFVTAANGGTPNPQEHAYLANTPPYAAAPPDAAHTLRGSVSLAAMATPFAALPGPFVVLNRTTDVATLAQRSNDELMLLAVHEAVHALDFRFDADTPIERYRTEFRAYWTDGRFGPPDQPFVAGRPDLSTEFDPDIRPPGPKSPRAQQVFHQLYDDPVTYPFVRDNYDKNTNRFRELVDTYLIPDGIDLTLSLRLWRLREVVDAPFASFATYRASIRRFFGVGAPPPDGVLDASERAYIRSSRMWRERIFVFVAGAANRATLLADMGIPP